MAHTTITVKEGTIIVIPSPNGGPPKLRMIPKGSKGHRTVPVPKRILRQMGWSR